MAATTASNQEIARLADAHARADFATWQMMAKLKSLDALPDDAQAFYAGHLKLMGKPGAVAEAAVETTIQTVYAAYYTRMGGTGTPPRRLVPRTSRAAKPGTPVEPDAIVAPLPRSSNVSADGGTNNVTPFRRVVRPAAAAPAAKRSLPVALIFASLVALAVAWHFAKTGF